MVGLLMLVFGLFTLVCWPVSAGRWGVSAYYGQTRWGANRDADEIRGELLGLQHAAPLADIQRQDQQALAVIPSQRHFWTPLHVSCHGNPSSHSALDEKDHSPKLR